jgi:opacity protein-like surface antigen
VSANANIGTTRTVGAGASARTLNTGEDHGTPLGEMLLEYAFPLGEGRSGAAGLSGVFGAEDLDGVDGGVPQVIDGLTIRGELHYGANTDAFLMGGGINTGNGDALEAASGWAGVEYKPIKSVTLNVLYGHERIIDADLSAGSRERNQVGGVNVQYAPFDPIVFGLEYTYFRTGFDQRQNAADNMIWGSVIFKL